MRLKPATVSGYRLPTVSRFSVSHFSHVILIGPRRIKYNTHALKIAMFLLCVKRNLQDQSARATLFVAQDMKRTIHTQHGLQLHSRGWTQSKVSAGGEHQAVMRF